MQNYFLKIGWANYGRILFLEGLEIIRLFEKIFLS